MSTAATESSEDPAVPEVTRPQPLQRDILVASNDGWFVDRALPGCVRAAADTIDIDSLVSSVVERCADTVFTRHSHDVDFKHRLQVSVTENAYALRDVLAGRLRMQEVDLHQVLAFATLQAELRIPQMWIHRSYRISFFLQWEKWTRHLESYIRETDIPRGDAVGALSELTRIVLSYQDHVASRVSETYTRDFEALNRSRGHVRRRLVHDILRGEHSNLTASDVAILAYPLGGHHVAVLLPSMAEGAASQLVAGLRSAANACGTLLYPLALNSTVAWLCRRDPWSESATGRVRTMLDELGVTASLSTPGSGIEGFRNTLDQATQVEHVRSAWGEHQAPRLLSYVDTGLEILLIQNPDLARAFVETELGPLAVDSSEAERLCETLEASFRCGSHVAAAEVLQLHEHTVRNRLHKAEQLLGHSLQERRTELQVALRLMRLVSGAGST